MEPRPIRVMIAHVGLDGRDREAKILARALRDGGMEVVYLGLHQTPDAVVAAAVSENVDALSLWSFAGAHGTHLPRVVEGIQAAGRDDMLVVAGGIIPPEDAVSLVEIGVAAVFPPDTLFSTSVAYIRDHAPRPRGPTRTTNAVP